MAGSAARRRVPCAPVRDLADALDADDLAERDMLAAYEHPVLGAVQAVGMPLHVSGYDPVYGPSPDLGADTSALLRELGYDDAEMARLSDAGAFGAVRL